MNKYQDTPEKIIDLHGYTVSEAEMLLFDVLKEREYSHIRMITGKGAFREHGPVLRDFVKKYLTKRGVRVEQSKIQDGGDGALEVYL